MPEDNPLRTLVAQVAAAYFSNAHVNPSDIPGIVQQIATSLSAVTAGLAVEKPSQSELTLALTRAQIRKSIRSDALISFEDGKAYKILKPHLKRRGLTMAEYWEKWGLPKDYPSVAPEYSAHRSQMAKTLGLGKKSEKTAPPEPPPAAAAKRARSKKSAEPVEAVPEQTNETAVADQDASSGLGAQAWLRSLRATVV